MRKATTALVLALAVLLAGCGEKEKPAEEDRSAYEPRAAMIGVTLDRVYVTEADGYTHALAGGAGAYGEDGFSDHYADTGGRFFQLIVDDDPELTDESCPALTLAGVGTTADVECARDGDGWYRTGGGRHEYAENRDGFVIRAAAVADVPAEALRQAVANAHPATNAELDAMLPDCGTTCGETPPRGDIPSGGDMAPQDPPGKGG